MDTQRKILAVALDLAAKHPLDKISYADIAKKADVHWTTVRRHLGNKQEMRALLAEKLTEHGERPANKDTRTRILEAASRTFAKYGLSGATLDQVAADAGMTKGAVYWHYSSKNELYLALCEQSIAQQTKLIPKQAEAILSAEDPIQALTAWLYSHFKVCRISPDLAMLFFEFLVHSREEAIREKLSSAFGELYHQIGLMFEALQEKGRLRSNVDPKAMAVYLQSLLHGLLVSWVIDSKNVEMDSIMEDLAHLLWNGFSSGNNSRNE